jgi:hypothetical protein
MDEEKTYLGLQFKQLNEECNTLIVTEKKEKAILEVCGSKE